MHDALAAARGFASWEPVGLHVGGTVCGDALAAAVPGGQVREIIPDSQYPVIAYPRYSPDGSTIAWSPDGTMLASSGTIGVHLVSVTDGSSRRITENGSFGAIDWR